MTVALRSTSAGFSLPVLGLGTYKMGGVLERDPQNDDERDIAAIRRAIDAGVTHIDTAELYAAGHCETLVGMAISGIERESLTIASKVMPQHLTYDGVLRSAENSLSRMGTEYLDLYLIHKTFPGQDISEAVRALDALVDRGLVRHIGVSNFSVDLLKKAQRLAKHPIANNQIHFSLLVREAERTGLLAHCLKTDVLVTAWRPVHLGDLAAKGLPLMDRLCAKYSATPAQIAINWVLGHPGVVTICKMSAPDHLRENLGALTFELESQDMRLLTDEYPGQLDVSPSVPLCG